MYFAGMARSEDKSSARHCPSMTRGFQAPMGGELAFASSGHCHTYLPEGVTSVGLPARYRRPTNQDTAGVKEAETICCIFE